MPKYFLDCPICIAYITELDRCDCGCEQYVCDACQSVFTFVEAPINTDLHRNGILCELAVIAEYRTPGDEDHKVEGGPAFTDAANYTRYCDLRYLRLGAATDQLYATLNEADEEE